MERAAHRVLRIAQSNAPVPRADARYAGIRAQRGDVPLCAGLSDRLDAPVCRGARRTRTWLLSVGVCAATGTPRRFVDELRQSGRLARFDRVRRAAGQTPSAGGGARRLG